MQLIAKFAMRSPLHAIGISMVAASIPLFGWVSAAIVALVVMSQGLKSGGIVFLWTLIPFGMALYYSGDPTSIYLMLAVAALGASLRSKLAWEHVLVFALLLSFLGAYVYQSMATDILRHLVTIYLQLLSGIEGVGAIGESEAMEMLLAGYALVLYLAMIALLSLARWCQSRLYNPSGFRNEFHSLRFPAQISLVVVLMVFVCLIFKDKLGVWIPLLGAPLLIAGLGFVHWIFAKTETSVYWLVGFYAMLLVFFQIFYPMLTSLAILDSFLNLRGRYKFDQKE
ncbi:MAG: hypothetical protein CMQ40_09010 [Gammaproteobacteria bacterium]|nr:hypothetical protein [Gammaproteobacteria bacterium]